tara:strand:- start:44 stop:1009 length:966 start_codon:yes stop_codon:yes gene_type:complete
MTRLVGYGCSNTAGDELTDHLILKTTAQKLDMVKREIGGDRNLERLFLHQSQPGGSVQTVWEYLYHHFGFQYDPRLDGMGITDPYAWQSVDTADDWASKFPMQVEPYSRSLTWVRHLAEHGGYTQYMNRGQGGGSVEMCLYYLQTDLMSGAVNPAEDKIVVQVPHPYRWLGMDFDGDTYTIRPNDLMYKTPIDPKQPDELNFYTVSYRYCTALKHLKMLGAELFFIHQSPQALRRDVLEDNPVGLSSGPYSGSLPYRLVQHQWEWVFDNAVDYNKDLPTADISGNSERGAEGSVHGCGHYIAELQKEIGMSLSQMPQLRAA